MKILDIDNYDKHKFFIKEKENSKRFNVNYDNKIFAIDPNVGFKNCKIYSEKSNIMTKIKIPINIEDEEHEKFKELITCIYDNISEYIERKDNICISHIVNPFNIISDTYTIFAILNKNTIIKNLDNQKTMDINELKGKILDIYPIFYSPDMTIYEDRIYINLTIHTLFVKIVKNWDNNINIDYQKIIKKMSELK